LKDEGTCISLGSGGANPAERLAFPHKEQPLPYVLNESNMARLIETPDTGPHLAFVIAP